MELNEQIFLGACALLAPEVDRNGFSAAEGRIDEAIVLAQAVWNKIVSMNL